MLDLPDAKGVPMGHLSSQQQPFLLHYHDLDSEDEVEVFRCVIGQNGKLIHSGDFVKLSSNHHEVYM